MSMSWLVADALAVGLVCASAGCGSSERCGPESAVVTNVVDGDTIDLDSGERVRYLLVDTPESTNGATDCFGSNAAQYNSDLVLGKRVTLVYDQECKDRFDRLLAYVSVDGQEVNTLLVERGYGCVLYIPPNGEDRRLEFEALEDAAQAAGTGMWGACAEVTCN
jgi:micrococcal nuclease